MFNSHKSSWKLVISDVFQGSVLRQVIPNHINDLDVGMKSLISMIIDT